MVKSRKIATQFLIRLPKLWDINMAVNLIQINLQRRRRKKTSKKFQNCNRMQRPVTIMLHQMIKSLKNLFMRRSQKKRQNLRKNSPRKMRNQRKTFCHL